MAIQNCKDTIRETETKISELNIKLDESRMTEIRNSYGIMQGSVLIVTAVEARDLKSMDINGLSDPYIRFECENQHVETSVQYNTLNPIWNETFTFDIQQGNPLNVLVMDKDSMKSDDFEG